MRNSGPFIIVVFLILAAIAGLFALLSGASDRRLDASVIGINGLAVLLAENDIAAKRSHPRLSPHVRDLGLRVLPLYDVNIERSAPDTDTPHNRFFNASPRDIYFEELDTKINELPTLIALPKWVAGVADINTAHADALIPGRVYPRLLKQIGADGLVLKRGENAMISAGSVSLFLAQTFRADSLPGHCKALRHFDGGVLVARCVKLDNDAPFYLLSDPDLINNHGLAVGHNTSASMDLLAQLSPEGGRAIYIDTSPDLLTIVDEDRDERREYTREASEFARFFTAPFDVLWVMLVLVVAVLFWRGAVRFGPLAPDAADSPEQSKSEAIATNARLLRLSGHDGRMVSDFVRGQLADHARATLGSAAVGQAGMARYFAFLIRRNEARGRAFQASAYALMRDAPNMTRAQLQSELVNYRTLLESVTNAHHDLT